MNLDIVSTEGKDLRLQRTDVPKAANILSVQLGSLEYAPSFGVDLKFFLESDFQLQTASFKAYCVDRLLNNQINVMNAIETVRGLDETITYLIGDSDQGTGLIA